MLSKQSSLIDSRVSLMLLLVLLLTACAPQSEATRPAMPAAVSDEETMIPADTATATALPTEETSDAAAPDQSATPQTSEQEQESTEEATPTVEAQAESSGGDTADSQQTFTECPQATSDSQRLLNPNQGYCLLYPSEYKVEKPNEVETTLVIGGLLNPDDPRASINVTPADGRSAAEVADEILADFASSGEVEVGEVSLAGEAGIRMDGLPGQNTYRQVIAVHDGQLFTLIFSPLGGQASAGMELLYQEILDTFTFIQPMAGEFEECLQADQETKLLRNEELGYCLLLPGDYQSEQANQENVVYYVESILNTGRPRLFVEVTEAGGKSAAEAADDFLSDLPPGLDIQRTFGLTVGYEVAETLDNVPGQDISRLVLVVHDGRLYELTFVPASQDAGEVYTEMEALFDLVTKSFRFLP